jgi:hypothetical protein
MPSTLTPTRVPCGLCVADGPLLGSPIGEDHQRRGRPAAAGLAIPVTIALASPALAVHPADAAQNPSCLYHE